jgi:TolB protein
VSSLGGGRDIYSQRVNGKGETVGEPERLTTGLQPHSISISADGGVLAYSVFVTSANIWSAPLNGTRMLRTEEFRQITSGNQTTEAVSVSPDDRWLAFDSNVTGNSDIYKLPVGGGDAQQLTRDPADEFNPRWSPNGSEIAFHGFREGNRDIFIVSSDGSRREVVAGTPSDERIPVWSFDGQQIAYQVIPDSILVVRRSGAGWSRPRLLARGVIPSWSPTDDRIAFIRDDRIVVTNSTGTNIQSISSELSMGRLVDALAWSKDSRLIYFSGPNDGGLSRIIAVDSRSGKATPIWTATDPLRQLFRSNVAVSSNNIYFTLGARESDVWIMNLSRK